MLFHVSISVQGCAHVGQLGGCPGCQSLRGTRDAPLPPAAHPPSKQGMGREVLRGQVASFLKDTACRFKPFSMPTASACSANEAVNSRKEVMLDWATFLCGEATWASRAFGPFPTSAAAACLAGKVASAGKGVLLGWEAFM